MSAWRAPREEWNPFRLTASGLFGCALLLATPPAFASAPQLWYAARSKLSRVNWLKGDDACPPGAADCNPCAEGVAGQLFAMRNGSLEWRTASWQFVWEQRVAPTNHKPEDAWWAGENLIAYHPQGFVRIDTGGPVRYAMSHSDDSVGSVSFVAGDGGGNYLWSLHKTWDPHPSGLFALGRYVGFVDGTHRLRFLDSSLADQHHDISYIVDESDGGPGLRRANGGVAMTKLFGGGFLLFVGEGGAREPAQDTDLYFMDGPLTSPTRVEYLGRVPDYYPAENLAVFTECGTRDIYTAHMMGANSGSPGSWSFSKLHWEQSPKPSHPGAEPWLEPWGSDVVVSGGLTSCHHRSAASVSVRDNGAIDLYCHGRNPLQQLPVPVPDGPALWGFQEGLNYGE